MQSLSKLYSRKVFTSSNRGYFNFDFVARGVFSKHYYDSHSTIVVEIEFEFEFDKLIY